MATFRFTFCAGRYETQRFIEPEAQYRGEPVCTDFHELRTVGAGTTALMTGVSIVLSPSMCAPAHCAQEPVHWLRGGHFLDVKTDGSNEIVFQWDTSTTCHWTRRYYVRTISETILAPLPSGHSVFCMQIPVNNDTDH